MLFKPLLILSAIVVSASTTEAEANLRSRNLQGNKKPKPAKVPKEKPSKVKISICHFDKELSEFLMISVPQKAASTHLARHNDAYPGEAAPGFDGMCLDNDCLMMPCGGDNTGVTAP